MNQELEMANNPLFAAYWEFENTLYYFDYAENVADRGEPMLAREIEEEATAEIKQMFEKNVDLQALMPQLWSELRNSENFADRLPTFYEEIGKARSHVMSCRSTSNNGRPNPNADSLP